ncbi:MAG: hypothetical protein NTZ97_02060 [Candidatus Moranbacteria bacterium]|nr:hypothetical protein [Candidatus Moranbacteria bacterium]
MVENPLIHPAEKPDYSLPHRYAFFFSSPYLFLPSIIRQYARGWAEFSNTMDSSAPGMKYPYRSSSNLCCTLYCGFDNTACENNHKNHLLPRVF